MKKIITVLLAFAAIVIPAKVLAVDDAGMPAKFWTYPVVYALDEEVTWYIDVSGTSFPEGVDLYLWAWSPTEPDAGNWENSSDFAKMEYEGDRIYKKTLIPTEYYGVPVGDIQASAGFWMRVKDKTGTLQSDVIQMPWSVAEITTFTSSGKAVQIFPEDFYLDTPVSILVNAEKVWTGAVQGGLVGKPSIHLHSGLNAFDADALMEYQAWVPERVEKTKLKPIGNNIYKIDFITPRKYYGVGEDYVMENIQFVLPSTDWVAVGTDEGGKDFVFRVLGVPIPPDPAFYFFPKKLSQLDMLTLVRTDNEKNSEGLVYTITAGNKTLTGEFVGRKENRRAYINLLGELAGTTVTKITLKLEHLNGAEILTTDIPLVPLSELE
ncbi:hypothetical protein EZS27_016945 [termite gut metagenome]|uniref:Uncharacterized protein n=1 Tax=termite gut metagenome TaxID=433724 RepID=A0A5J4RNW5_9ZZZZ